MAADATAAPMLPEELREKIRSYLPRYPNKRAVTLPALHMVHEYFRCVPRRAMAEIAEILEITPAEVHDTMSFYGFFPQAPIGDVRVWVCRSISCMLRGGDKLFEHACRAADVQPGGTSADGKVTVEFAECLGLCDHAPVALADDGRIFALLDEPTAEKMIETVRRGRVAEAPVTPVLAGTGEAATPGVGSGDRDAKV